jgi:hypothetical protein
MGSRGEAVDEGRAMVRVVRMGTGEHTTAGVCPGCWNSPRRRPALIAKLAGEGLSVAHPADAVDGVYKPHSAHAPECPWRKS